MNENLNLVEILKDCPKGTKLYSSVYGYVVLVDVNEKSVYPIRVIILESNDAENRFTKEGFLVGGYSDSECVLFPSKEQRDWSKFVCPKPKPAFKPYDRVVVKGNTEWRCDIFSHYHGDYAVTISNHVYEQGEFLPYEGNEHLVGEEVDE